MKCEQDDFVVTKPGRTPSLGRRVQPIPFAARWLTLAFVFGLARAVGGYSVLTHEEIVDMLWNDEIQPLLLKRFPGADAEQLRHAHAHAYGGCLIQDIGYYPFGKKFFSDLVHYVRTGDFVANLIAESSNLDEYAFGLGALAHYASDSRGHPTINRVVGMQFPKLRAKYGEQVTYAECPKAHIRTEFGFDLVQVAKRRYTSDHYHDLIGFEVAKPLLERAFLRTYGLRLQDVLGHVDLAIGTFRRGVSEVIPEMTRVALVWKRLDIVRETPNFDERKFRYYLSRADYEKEWGKEYRRPGLVARILAFFLKWMPKFGPFEALAFKIPTTETEDLYIRSVNKTVEGYRAFLQAVGRGELRFANTDCDTGQKTAPGEYTLADDTYARLLDQLSRKGFKTVSPDLRLNILSYYDQSEVPYETKRQRKLWLRTLGELERLKTAGSAQQLSRRPAVTNASR